MPYKATERNKKYLHLYKQGKSIGFTMRSSLKAKGLIPRANGTYRVSNKYDAPIRMVNRTRKVRKGGAWPWASSPTNVQMAQTAANNAKRQAAINTKRSKTRVANVLGKKALNKGNVVYTNKERIASELEAKLHNIADQYGVEIDALERDIKQAALPPKTVIDTLKGLIAQLKTQTAAPAGGGLSAEQKAIIITIPYGLGQLTLKVLRVALYIAITFIALSATLVSSGMFLGAYNPFGATGILPNSGFESTSSFYKSAMGKPPKNGFNTPNPMMAQLPPY